MSGFYRPRWPRLADLGGRWNSERLRSWRSRIFGEESALVDAPEDLPEPKALPPGERVYAVGDIHGRADLASRMQELIRGHAARAPPASVTVVWLGDYVDRGADTAGVLQRLLTETPVPGLPVVNLVGNHDETMLHALSGDRAAAFPDLEHRNQSRDLPDLQVRSARSQPTIFCFERLGAPRAQTTNPVRERHFG